MSQRAAIAGNYQGKIEKISDPTRMSGLLQRAMESRVLLTVSAPNSTEAYNSALLEVRPERGYLELDEFKPKPERSQELDKLHVSTRLNGVEISFATRVESVGERDGIALYRVRYPTSLNYLQRRSHYRARVGFARTIPVTLYLEGGQSVVGHLRDISVGGIGASFPLDLPDSVADSRFAQDCSIALPTGETIKCLIDVCFINHSLQEDNARIVGARFVRLGPQELGTVARFVSAVDRESMKHRQRHK